jgi:hypothetical protein
MKTEQRELNGFEQRLLDELKRIVVERPSFASLPAAPADHLRARFGWRRKLMLAGAIAAASALAVTAGLPFVDGGGVPTAVGPSAAYAVTANDNGTVTVEINALREAEGLERKLRQAGVPAVVRYLPPGNACSEGTFMLIRPGGPEAGAIQMSEDGSMRFEIDKSALQPGQKLFIYSVDRAPGRPSGSAREPASTIAISIVDGKVVAGC